MPASSSPMYHRHHRRCAKDSGHYWSFPPLRKNNITMAAGESRARPILACLSRLTWRRSVSPERVSRAFRDRRARAAEAYAVSKVRVARYLETGDLADLFPERSAIMFIN
jgi:hypothetical protein